MHERAVQARAVGATGNHLLAAHGPVSAVAESSTTEARCSSRYFISQRPRYAFHWTDTSLIGSMAIGTAAVSRLDHDFREHLGILRPSRLRRSCRRSGSSGARSGGTGHLGWRGGPLD
jgi:hypothetical protein